jgi:hypothetical protein
MLEILKKYSIVNLVASLVALILIVTGIIMALVGGEQNRKDIQLYNKAIAIYNQEDYISATATSPASYPLDNLSEAVSDFQQAASLTGDDKFKSLIFYNIATIIGRDFIVFSEDRSDEFGLALAITLLKEAIWLDPYNEDAKYNLEYLEYYASFYDIS